MYTYIYIYIYDILSIRPKATLDIRTKPYPFYHHALSHTIDMNAMHPIYACVRATLMRDTRVHVTRA